MQGEQPDRSVLEFALASYRRSRGRRNPQRRCLAGRQLSNRRLAPAGDRFPAHPGVVEPRLHGCEVRPDLPS